MAADIKNYLKEKEKRQKSQDDYKKKIRKHRLTIVYRVLLVVAALGASKRAFFAGSFSSEPRDLLSWWYRQRDISIQDMTPYLPLAGRSHRMPQTYG